MKAYDAWTSLVAGSLGLLSPVMAGLVHITHTLGILANSSRLLFFEPPQLLPEEVKGKSAKRTGTIDENRRLNEDAAVPAGGASYTGTDSSPLRH